jgi:hypothetical protein
MVFEISMKGFLYLLRINDHRVGADIDCAGTREPVDFFLVGLDIRGGMIRKLRAVVMGVAVEARLP